MSNDQTSPTPQAAETKVLPRFPIPEGFRLLQVGETLQEGDRFDNPGDGWIPTYNPGVLHDSDSLVRYIRPIAIEPTPQAPAADACDVCHGSGSVWRSQGDGDPDFEVDCQSCHPDAPKAPEGTSPAPWMADSRPLLAEIASLSARVLSLQTQASSLVSTIAAAQTLLTRWIVPDSDLDDRAVLSALLGILDNKELVELMKGASRG